MRDRVKGFVKVHKAIVDFCQVVPSLLINGREGENMVCSLKILSKASLASGPSTQSVSLSRENNVQNYGIEFRKGMPDQIGLVVA